MNSCSPLPAASLCLVRRLGVTVSDGILGSTFPVLRSRFPSFLWLGIFCFSAASAIELASVIPIIPMVATIAPAEAPEYHIKAGYLRRFMRYVEWPPAVFAQASEPVVVGVLGTNPFGEVLRETLHGLKIQNHEVEVHLVQTVEEAARCQVVFIARRQERNEAVWLAALRGKPVLTISESAQGLAQGAVLSLAYENTGRGHRVVFNASLPAAREAGLQLSSSMLISAKKVFRDLAEIKGGS